MAKKQYPMCARCAKSICYPRTKLSEGAPPLAEAPPFCPMKLVPEVIKSSLTEYEKPAVKEFARQASIQEFECYEQLPDGRRTKNTRVEELVQLSRKCGYKKLGLAFCGGLASEARLLVDLLENKGFQVVSVRCKVGGTQKERIGIKDTQKIEGPGAYETMCSPITQAEVLNNANVDFVVMMGLCIGHDTLFIKYCRLPMTVIAVKDRVLGHNPLAALYCSGSYYRRLMAKTE